MYKVLNDETPEYLSSRFINRMALLAMPRRRNDHYKRSFRQASSLASFKSQIRCYDFQGD